MIISPHFPLSPPQGREGSCQNNSDWKFSFATLDIFGPHNPGRCFYFKFTVIDLIGIWLRLSFPLCSLLAIFPLLEMIMFYLLFYAQTFCTHSFPVDSFLRWCSPWHFIVKINSLRKEKPSVFELFIFVTPKLQVCLFGLTLFFFHLVPME